MEDWIPILLPRLGEGIRKNRSHLRAGANNGHKELNGERVYLLLLLLIFNEY